MPFSFETFAWAVSALFQLLAVCAYLLSFPDVDGVDDQLPDMPEVIQDSAIEMKITYSGIIFVFGFYTQVVVVKQSWNWWRKKMEEPDNSLMVMVGVYVHNLICNFFQVSHDLVTGKKVSAPIAWQEVAADLEVVIKDEDDESD